MRVYSLKAFAGLTILSIILGVGVAEVAYLGLDALYPYASTSSEKQGDEGWSGPPLGEITLSAFAVSPSYVELTLSLVNRRPTSYYNLMVYIADLHAHHTAGLPEGFELVNGNLSWHGSADIPELNLKATIRAVKDGVWNLTGKALWYGHGAQGLGPGILEIVVSNGKVTDIRRVEPEFIEPVLGRPLIPLQNASEPT